MTRAAMTSLTILCLAVPAFAAEGEMDPSKMKCSDHYAMQAKKMMKHGQTLIDGGKLRMKGVKFMRKWNRAEAMLFARISMGMIKSGGRMKMMGKWLARAAERFKGGKHDHTMAEHMAGWSKIPGEVRKDVAEKGKAWAGEMKEWGNEMAKEADMLTGMFDKMAAAGGGGEEKKGE